MTVTTTLKAIRKHKPCESGWRKLLAHLGKTRGDDDPLPLITILESNGLDDTLWCFRALGPEHEAWARLVVCDIAERALRFVPAGEDRPRRAIETARRYARGEATAEELDAAGDAAWDAGDAAWAAARAAGDAAWAAPWAAAWAAGDAAWAAARAAGDAERAERAEQARILRAALEERNAEAE